MTIHLAGGAVTLHHGDCREVLAGLEDASISSIVTDPPYELGFMGKAWDASGIAYNVQMWRECLRVLKPGGHVLAFGGTRTYHRMAAAIEDAGFEIRDSIHWLYGSGFPKSLDVSKAIDKAAGAEREVTGPTVRGAQSESTGRYGAWGEGITPTAPATEAAKQWDGWGTALKPAHEPVVMARKPLIGTVAANVLEYGTGALNIDGCRVEIADGDEPHAGHRTATFGTQETVSGGDGSGGWQAASGRWPANVVVDQVISQRHGWARYFYCAKPNGTERNAGLEGLPVRHKSQLGDDYDSRDGLDPVSARFVSVSPVANHHPTVKPVELMRWLIRLVTPPDGVVLDPFAGSGTTLVAAVLEGFAAVGIELTEEYLPIITGRVTEAHITPQQLDLFGGVA